VSNRSPWLPPRKAAGLEGAARRPSGHPVAFAKVKTGFHRANDLPEWQARLKRNPGYEQGDERW